MTTLAPPAARPSAPPRGPAAPVEPAPHRTASGDELAGFPSPDRLADRDLPPEGTALTGEQFLALPFGGVRAEWVDGTITYLPMTSELHRAIQMWLIAALIDYRRVREVDAKIRAAGTGVSVPRGYDEPDVTFILDTDDPRRANAIRDMVWLGADVVFEIVSPSDPDRDHVRKRDDYAGSEVGEYWIVDPRGRARTVTVLTADGAGGWNERVFAEGETATGTVLDGFAVDVAACLNGD